jgi:hypothetical protein
MNASLIQRMTEIAYDRGYDVGRNGLDVAMNNPYRPGTMQHDAFVRGVDSGMDDAFCHAWDC